MYPNSPLTSAKETNFYFRNQRQRLNLVPALLCLFLPWILYCLMSATMAFEVRYRLPHFSALFLALGLMFVALVGLAAVWSGYKKWNDRPSHTPNWWAFLFLTSLIAWILAVIVGQEIFTAFLRDYADYQGMNFYESVNPSKTPGKAMMDVGTIDFARGSRVDLTRSMSFQERETYCVAPLVADPEVPPTPRRRRAPGGTTAAAASEEPGPAAVAPPVDFWAVGKNCCNGAGGVFSCGMSFNQNPGVGMRVLNEGELKFYRAALKQAVAEHQMDVENPLFFYLTASHDSNPSEILQIEAHKYYIIGMVAHFGFQLFCVGLAVFGFWRAGLMV